MCNAQEQPLGSCGLLLSLCISCLPRTCMCAAAAGAAPVLLDNAVVQAQKHTLAGFQQGHCCDASLVLALVHHRQGERRPRCIRLHAAAAQRGGG